MGNSVFSSNNVTASLSVIRFYICNFGLVCPNDIILVVCSILLPCSFLLAIMYLNAPD